MNRVELFLLPAQQFWPGKAPLSEFVRLLFVVILVYANHLCILQLILAAGIRQSVKKADTEHPLVLLVAQCNVTNKLMCVCPVTAPGL